MKKIEEMDIQERPREKLLLRGASALSDLELMAVLLGRGSRGYPVMTLASNILKLLDTRGAFPDLATLQGIRGVGEARAAMICAAMEFARRRIRPAGLKIHLPTDILDLVRHYADRKQEYFLCTTLNGANEMIATRVITVGLVNQTQIHPREVFADAISDRAAAIIVAHNHPSGSITHGRADEEITARLLSAGDLLGIRLLDHIIFTHSAYFSFAEAGLL